MRNTQYQYHTPHKSLYRAISEYFDDEIDMCELETALERWHAYMEDRYGVNYAEPIPGTAHSYEGD